MTRLPKKILCFTALIIAVALPVGEVLAKDAPAGSVVAARGSVEASDAGGAVRTLKIKSEVFATDTVRTGRDGRAQLMFSDNTIVSLGVNSTLKVAEYHWDDGQKTGTMKTRVEEGTFRVLGGLITKTAPKNFSTETPAATIGIRGSMYAGKVTGGETIVVFLGGRGIVVFNPQGQVELTRPGYGVRVRFGEAPGDPRPFTPEELEELIDSLAKRSGVPDDEGFRISDHTTDFDKGTEDNLPFDPDGFTVPLGDLIGQVFLDYGQEMLLAGLSSGLGGTITLEGTAVGLIQSEWGYWYDRFLLSGAGAMDDVLVTIDRDTGKLSGSFCVSGYNPYYELLEVYPIIDSDWSVYVNDQNFAAGLVCEGETCVDYWPDGLETYPIDSLESEVVTAPAAEQFSDYMTWGYWQVVYNDGGGEPTTYSLDPRGSLWIAGEKTPADYVDNLLSTAGFTATYEGPAYGIMINSDYTVIELTGGETILHADFMNDWIDGTIGFDQHDIAFAGPISSDGGYYGSFRASDNSGLDINTNVTGAFYGPEANAVGGSFYSEAGSDVYQGIFGGNLTGKAPSPPSGVVAY
jgi:hypothetical protein